MFLQDIAEHLTTDDVKNFRLVCKNIASCVDASYILNLHLLLGNKRIFTHKTGNHPVLFERRMICSMELDVYTLLFRPRHRSDTGK